MGVVKADESVLTSDDLGLTRGDGCFDATRVVTDEAGNHRIDHLAEHLDRFQRSSAALDLPDVDRAAWRSLIDELLAGWDVSGEAMLKLMITRGRESVPGGPITGIATLTPIAESTLLQRRNGITVVTLSRGTSSDAYLDAPWLLGGVKTLSYGVNVAAGRAAATRGAEDVIFVSTDGYLLEGPTSAVLWWSGGALHTTPVGGTGILASITQQAISGAAAAEGVPTNYRLGTVADLRQADGAWLVSSGRGVARLRAVDGAQLADTAELTVLTERVTTWAGF